MKKIPKLVQKALRLLKRDKKGKKIHPGQEFNSGNCPVACVYGVDAVSAWGTGKFDTSFELGFKDRLILRSKGWNKKIYESFLGWHDEPIEVKGRTIFRNRTHVLKTLGGKKNAA